MNTGNQMLCAWAKVLIVIRVAAEGAKQEFQPRIDGAGILQFVRRVAIGQYQSPDFLVVTKLITIPVR
jgi:hypothetical protein